MCFLCLRGDADAGERLFATSTARRKLIATDAVVGMDGDRASLRASLELARWRASGPFPRFSKAAPACA